ncbi:hypothetical protein L1987_79657 [Smallanthus sonchifolius]|uniref:Uncharacterized protein n=1 Tax=Smallanthus sonchifolius TaxID=185202 RepID=A0ACB8YL23_9ASTR|nr:hypothetical protein L1987_79657 [Smallanthus sonchifolius]
MLFLTLVLKSKSRGTRGAECVNTCGNITIPYPFGMEENCYLDRSYMVTCNTTTGRVTISDMNVDVVDISLDGHLHALSRVGRVYYTENGEEFLDESLMRLSRFPLSVGRNNLVTLGCYTSSVIKDHTDYKDSCSTLRGDCLHNVSCSEELNCCQNLITSGQLTSFHFKLEFNHPYNNKNYTNSSYALVVEDGWYDFSSFDVYDLSIEKLGSYEMRLEWTVGDTTCQEAQKNTSGYLCKETNVNECEDHNLNDCTHRCQNTAGSYTCHCPKGHNGDGRKGGTPCRKNKTRVEKLGLYIGTIMGVIITSVATFLSYFLLKQRRIAKKKEMLFKRNGGMIFKKLLSEREVLAEDASSAFHNTDGDTLKNESNIPIAAWLLR